MDELVIDGTDAAGAEVDLDTAEATAAIVIDSDFEEIEIVST